MELLAPAGSKESFIAALRGGADAVYAGVQGHNARVYAKNLSFYDLEVLLDHAHGLGKKVFIAFNTLIKQGEIKSVAAALRSIEKLGPDGLIVQDMGVARIARENFPGLELHASTQMAVHNSQGAALLAERGFKRVILARELSFSELKLIAARSSVELEIFIHGALCFSISGMCLFSSAIGGQSGNRGRCTQPCRRVWKSAEERGYVFSPRDLELAEHIRKIRPLGLKTLKIEGRMRSSDYVYRVVKAYRTLLDAGDDAYEKAIEEARMLLAVDYARAKTTALFSGRDPEMIVPGRAQCLGMRIGGVSGTSKGRISIEVSRPLEAGDRLRIADPRGDKTSAFKVKEFARKGERYVLPYSGEAFQKGAAVFLAGDAASEDKSFKKEMENIFFAYEKPRVGGAPPPHAKPYTSLLENQWSRKRNGAQADRLWIRIDDPAWAPLLPIKQAMASPVGEGPSGRGATDLVISLNADNLRSFLKAARGSSPALRDALFELPPYIGQREVPDFERAVGTLQAAGYSRWVLNNVSHFKIFKERPREMNAGHFLYTWNAYAALAWKELGVSRFVLSWEDDVLNITELCRLALRGDLVMYLYGHPPLSRSRFLTKEMCGSAPIEEAPGMTLRRVFEAGSGVVIPDAPVSLFSARKKLAERGIGTFGIDLSFIEPDRKRWESIHAGYRAGTNAEGTLKFNFKRCVK